MRRVLRALTLASAGAATSAAAGHGQQVSLELRGGTAVGNYTETYAGLEWVPGPSFAAEAQLELRPGLALVAGYARSRFGCEEGFCTDRDTRLTAQGLTVGGRWVPGLPWVRAGLAWQSLDVETVDGDASGDAEIGVDLGAGIDIGVGRSIHLRPGVTYRRVPSSLDAEDGHFGLIAFEIGVATTIFGTTP